MENSNTQENGQDIKTDNNESKEQEIQKPLFQQLGSQQSFYQQQHPHAFHQQQPIQQPAHYPYGAQSHPINMNQNQMPLGLNQTFSNMTVQQQHPQQFYQQQPHPYGGLPQSPMQVQHQPFINQQQYQPQQQQHGYNYQQPQYQIPQNPDQHFYQQQQFQMDRERVKLFRQLLEKYHGQILSQQDSKEYRRMERMYNWSIIIVVFSLPYNFYCANKIVKLPQFASKYMFRSMLVTTFSTLTFALSLYRYQGLTKGYMQRYLNNYSNYDLQNYLNTGFLGYNPMPAQTVFRPPPIQPQMPHPVFHQQQQAPQQFLTQQPPQTEKPPIQTNSSPYF